MLDPTTVAAVPWRNGAGTTRELAAATDAEGGTAWRISLATLDRDAVFSSFPDVDRLFVALGSLCLTVDGAVSAMTVGDQRRFAGEVPVSVRLDGATTALNVMTRRGRYRPEVSLRPDASAPEGTDVTVLLPGGAAHVRLQPVRPSKGSDD